MSRRCSFHLAWSVPLCLIMAATASAWEVDDAQVVALEISGELLAPPDLVRAVQLDLNAIRTDNGYFEQIHVYPSWLPGQLLVGLMTWAWEQYENGEYHGLDELNEQYGPVEIHDVIPGTIKLTFTRDYHPLVLEDIYEHAPGVSYVEANSPAGDGNDISAEEVGTYTFRKGWGDCPAGCMYEHVWVFQVTDGEVELIDESGTPIPEATVKWR